MFGSRKPELIAWLANKATSGTRLAATVKLLLLETNVLPTTGRKQSLAASQSTKHLPLLCAPTAAINQFVGSSRNNELGYETFGLQDKANLYLSNNKSLLLAETRQILRLTLATASHFTQLHNKVSPALFLVGKLANSFISLVLCLCCLWSNKWEKQRHDDNELLQLN